jgi:hypothetical protein
MTYNQKVDIATAMRIISTLKYAGDIEKMLRDGKVDFERLAKLLQKFNIKVEPEKLYELQQKYNETKDEMVVIEGVAEMLNIPTDALITAIETYKMIASSLKE